MDYSARSLIDQFWQLGDDAGDLLGHVVVGGLVIGAVGFVALKVAYAVRKRQQMLSDSRRRDELERRQIAEKKAAEQRYAVARLNNSNEGAICALESLPNHLSDADNHIGRAESEFQDGAFSPFWEEIELAAVALGKYTESIATISRSRDDYAQFISTCGLEGDPPPFAVSPAIVSKVRACDSATRRLSAVVRDAQRNFQFATIFEQRKTNQILVSGFKNLGDALYGMSSRISDDIAKLDRSIMTASDSLGSHISQMRNDNASFHRQQMSALSDHAYREQQALRALDRMARRTT